MTPVVVYPPPSGKANGGSRGQGKRIWKSKGDFKKRMAAFLKEHTGQTDKEASGGTRCGRSHEGNTPYAARFSPHALRRTLSTPAADKAQIASTYDASPSCGRPVARGAVSLKRARLRPS